MFVEALRDYSNFKRTKEMVKEAKTKILSELKMGSYLHTNIETPIFTIKSSMDKDLQKELSKQNVIVESGLNFINLDKNYARIRINREYEKLSKILKKF